VQSGTHFSNREFFYFTHPLSSDNPASSETYLKKKISLSLISIFLTLAYLALLAFTAAKGPFLALAAVSTNIYLSFLIFVLALDIFFSLVKFPFDYYADFVLEHRFALSNQSFTAWLGRKLKGALIGGILGVIVLIAFYFMLVHFPRLWWLVFAAFFFAFQVLVAQLFPTLILPLFYKLKPLANEGLHSRLEALVQKFGYRMGGVFSFDLSRETKKANAALTGLGKTRKIIISDTLLENFTGEEIEVVLSHELGHLVKHHMMKGIMVSAIVSLMGFFIMAQLYSAYAAAAGIPVYSLPAVPFLAFLVSIFGIVAMPLGNFYSRRIEHEADMFALSATGMKKEFAESMRKLGKLNMTPENPPAWIEKIFFSHPSIGARIRSAMPFEDPAAVNDSEGRVK
jgi:STE24 endopeptidase